MHSNEVSDVLFFTSIWNRKLTCIHYAPILQFRGQQNQWYSETLPITFHSASRRQKYSAESVILIRDLLREDSTTSFIVNFYHFAMHFGICISRWCWRQAWWTFWTIPHLITQRPVLQIYFRSRYGSKQNICFEQLHRDGPLKISSTLINLSKINCSDDVIWAIS